MFDALEPFGSLDTWKQASLIASMVVNAAPFRSKGSPVIEVNRFVPRYLIPEHERPKPRTPPTWQQQKAALKAYVKGSGGEVVTVTKDGTVIEDKDG